MYIDSATAVDVSLLMMGQGMVWVDGPSGLVAAHALPTVTVGGADAVQVLAAGPRVHNTPTANNF
jgi:hypothetical protein